MSETEVRTDAKKGWSMDCRLTQHRACAAVGARCACPCHGTEGQDPGQCDECDFKARNAHGLTIHRARTHTPPQTRKEPAVPWPERRTNPIERSPLAVVPDEDDSSAVSTASPPAPKPKPDRTLAVAKAHRVAAAVTLRRTLAYLHAHDGAIRDPKGGALALLAEGMKYESVDYLGQLMRRWDQAGFIARETKGRRTLSIALTAKGLAVVDGADVPKVPAAQPRKAKAARTVPVVTPATDPGPDLLQRVVSAAGEWVPIGSIELAAQGSDVLARFVAAP